MSDRPQPATPAESNRPILILGMRPRSGTNWLHGLLCRHPACQRADLAEDGLLQRARYLVRYTEDLRRSWEPSWNIPPGREDELLRLLGDALVTFLRRGVPDDRRVVTKTPSVRGLHNVFQLVPAADVLLLVRDGRAVVESGVRTFGRDRELAIRQWLRAAGEVSAFMASDAARAGRVRIVRYEDLVADQERELRGLFDFLDLDADVYDFDGARAEPVRGSSLLPNADGVVHWQPLDKPASFDGTVRWGDWSASRHARFHWLAGDAMRALGYDLDSSPAGPAAVLRQRLRDLVWALQERWRWVGSTGVRRVRHWARRMLGEPPLAQ